MDNSVFQGWDNFYVILGSAAAGLIGLLFIVVTLSGRFDRERVMQAIAIYTTPVALHLALVFSAPAVTMVPHLPSASVAALLGLCALVGLTSAFKSCIGIRRGIPGSEFPHWSDFWFYGIVPVAIYLWLACAAIGLATHAGWAPLATGGALLALLLAAIRNAWDLVTWMAPRAKELGEYTGTLFSLRDQIE